MNVGANIRKLRKEKKLTLKELGMKVDLSEQAIGQYERGDRMPNLENLSKIATALNININELLSSREITMDTPNGKTDRVINMSELDLEKFIMDLSSARFKNSIGIKKMAKLLDVDFQVLKEIENKTIPNADIIIRYAQIIDELLSIKKSLTMNLIDFGIFDDHNSIDLSDLLSLSKSQYSNFIFSVQKYMKFALEDAKNFPPSKDSINPYTESLFKKNDK